MPTIRHYGVFVDLDKPTTGVVQLNRVPWIDDDMHNGIDLAWKEHLDECKRECWTHDNCGPQERGTILAGSWKKNSDGEYEPDPDAEGAEYAAIIGEVYAQVVWSKRVVRVRSLCSPCYPGQADVDQDKIVAEGGYLAYDFPADMYQEHY